jgi:hypothetical protein
MSVDRSEYLRQIVHAAVTSMSVNLPSVRPIPGDQYAGIAVDLAEYTRKTIMKKAV